MSRWWVVVLIACRGGEAKPLDPKQLVEALEQGDPDPLAALITGETTWDGVTANGALTVGTTTQRATIVAAGAAGKALVGDFKRVSFVWTDDRWTYVLSEHATGDFIYMLRFDEGHHLAHLTFSTPDRLRGPNGCSAAYSKLLDDGTILYGPKADATPAVAIIGALGGGTLPQELAGALACRGVASLVVPAGKATPADVHFVVAQRGDTVPTGHDAIIVDDVRPRPSRDSGPAILASAHLAPAVVDQVVTAVNRR